MVSRAIPGGLEFAELLDRSNLLAIVTRQDPSKIQLWDEISRSCIMRADCGGLPISAFRVRKDMLLCALYDRVQLYTIRDDLELLFEYRTANNEAGLAELSVGPPYTTFFPGQRQGHLQILQYEPRMSEIATRTAGCRRNVIISAHMSELSCIAMSSDGTLVATASRTGTLIRIWSAVDGQQVLELRRGLDKAAIQSMSFSSVSASGHSKLAVVSNKATVHVYFLTVHGKDVRVLNGRSTFAFLASAGVTYFDGSWSTIQARIRDMPASSAEQSTSAPRRFVVGWSTDLVFVVLSHDGGFWKFVIAGGSYHAEPYTCHQECYRSWKNPCTTIEQEAAT